MSVGEDHIDDDDEILAGIKLEDPSESDSSSLQLEHLPAKQEADDFEDIRVPSPAFHPPAAPPFCQRCKVYDHEEYFNLQCNHCQENLKTASVPQIFAVLRQWSSDVQRDCQLYIQQVCFSFLNTIL